MAHFKIRQGARIEKKGAPVQQIEDADGTPSLALTGADFPGLRPAFKVEPGNTVTEGQTLFVDRRHPSVAFVSPMAGRVRSADYGPRRTLSLIVIERQEPGGDPPETTPPDDNAVRDALLARGFWPAFRTRPHGLLPEPDAEPDAIFVNAVAAGSRAPDPKVVLDGRLDDLRQGLVVLTRLTRGTVHLCQDHGAELCPGPPERVMATTFSGSHAAALAGTHIHRLHPVGNDGTVWTIGYQDVAAIGTLFRTGRHDGRRVIALCGPRAARPRLVRTWLGADLRALTEGEAIHDRRGNGVHILSGDAIAGRPAAYLGRYHDQVTIEAAPRRLAGQRRLAMNAPRALIPTAALESALPFDIMAVPLMRALAVGDTEAAQRLGCLELIEEDVALFSRRCTSGVDYGALLRTVLDDLRSDAA